jgi:hypothetical protein
LPASDPAQSASLGAYFFLIGYLRKIDPITPLSSYIAAIGAMVDDCRSAGITPVVLSPFVYGSRYAMRNAISYTNALRERLRAGDGILVAMKTADRRVSAIDGYE